jgi:uncharacterized membrane protein YraQ (UPF0718 family)
MTRKVIINLSIFAAFAVFVGVSFLVDFQPGIQVAGNSKEFLWSMIRVFPGAFMLIGLFDVWIDRRLVERHLGNTSGPVGYLWMFLLACTVMAPFIVALPIAKSLSEKGARLQMVLAFLSASTICRIPMTVFEATYLGAPFSLVRLLVSIPLVIVFSEILGRMFGGEAAKARINDISSI